MGQANKLSHSSLLLYAKCLRPKYLLPALEVPSINEVTPDILKKYRIRGVVFDVDNTLTTFRGVSIHRGIEWGLRDLANEFPCGLLSNTDDKRRASLEGVFGVPAVPTNIRKPHPEAFLQAAAFLGTAPNETAMVGDRLLTDIAGANIAGLFTVKVEPIDRTSEPLSHSLVRGFENLVYKFYKN
ncbi:MAG: YqeG family HAD IIIA-type phosphatase [Candidatus Pacearchaeota archaeon]|nr:YqeG family HAD IIIA-type phosphatase [Candidatus Pacearchaeota archaeon]